MEDTKKTKAQLIEELSLLRQQLAARPSAASHHEHTQATLLSLASVVQASIDSIVLADLAGKILDVNEATLRMYGTNDKGDLIGKNTLELIAPADRQRAVAYLQEVLARGTLQGREYRVILKSGATIPVELSAAVLKDAAGTPLGLVGISRDISERKQMEGALRQAEARARAISELVSDYAYAVRIASDGRVVIEWVTESYRRITGFTMQELEATGGIGRLIHPEDLGSVLQRLSALLAGRPGVSEHRILTKSGELRWLRDYSYPEWDAVQGRVVRIFGAGQDITDRKRAEEAVRHAKDAAEAATRAKSEFLATMSHELRTPLSIIIGYTDLLLEEDFGPATAEQHAALQRVRSAACQEVELITTLLDLSRLEAGRVRLTVTAVDMPELIAELRQETERGKRKPGLHFEWRVAPDVPPLWTDQFHLKVILTNLIGNALKFTERGSVMVAVYPHAGGVECRVTDTGSGITSEVQAVMFEMFRQGHSATDNHHGGVGLGLYIVKRLLELLHGTIVVESEVGKGSTFRVRIPQSSTRTGEKAEADPPRGLRLPGAEGQAGKGH